MVDHLEEVIKRTYLIIEREIIMWETKDELINYLLEQWEKSEEERLKLCFSNSSQSVGEFDDELYGFRCVIGSIKGKLPNLK
jgi:hypothetical protein